ncbi:MAG: hypothetical protein J6K84_05135 [Oscillospiraceae bacterium]|nr:hypothetical protein [Oscillospiraceae bacterium]
MKKHSTLKKILLLLGLLIVLTLALAGCKDNDTPAADSSPTSSSSSVSSNNVSTSQGKYCASKESEVYHYYTCQYVDNIKSSNLIRNDSANYFANRGYRPCKRCLE